jgi:hypothetical protein
VEGFDLINSKAIANYCKEINYKFSIEELAVLIYRNKNKTVYEKIELYKKLGTIHLHQDVNTSSNNNIENIVLKEIERLEINLEKFLTKEDGYIYYYGENEIRNVYTDIESLLKNVLVEKEENNKISEFVVYKKCINKNESITTAVYKVIGEEFKLIDVREEIEWINGMNNIVIKVPTPFKKGDLLIGSNNNYLDKECNKVFVLNDICNWYEKEDSVCDCNIMSGTGYYIEDNVVCFGECLNYDTFEYFNGKLEDMEYVLESISSLIKNEINISAFLKEYEKIKAEGIIKNINISNAINEFDNIDFEIFKYKN